MLSSLPKRIRAFGLELRASAPGVALLSVIVVIAFAINAWVPTASPIAVAVLLGLLVGNFIGWPKKASVGTAFAAKRLLRLGVALLGLQISVAALIEIGLPGLAVVVLVVFGTFFGVQLLGRLFGLPQPLRLIIGAGFAVCGVTAIAAVSPVARANREQTSYAVALVALFGTLSIAVFPAVAAWLVLDQVTAGSWVGAGVHDVAQVVATASIIGPIALDAAVVIKLTRVLMLVFIVLLVIWLSRADADDAEGSATAISNRFFLYFPPFILGFLAIVLVANTGLLSEGVVEFGVVASKVLLTFGCAALGVGVSWSAIRSIGARPLAMGAVAWVLVAGVALASVLTVGL